VTSSDPRPRDALVDAVIDGLRRVSAQSVLFSQAVADHLGMNPTDLECLDILAQAGPVTAGRLAELTGLTTGAITGVLNRLERAGYLARAQDPADRRRVVVQPNLERLGALDPLFRSMEGSSRELLARYGDADLRVLADFLPRALAVGQAETARLRGALSGDADDACFSSPLGSDGAGRLLLANPSRDLRLDADPVLGELFRARYEGRPPRVRVRGGTVSIQERRRPFDWRSYPARVSLNATVPWQIELRGSVSRLTADLRDARIVSLQIEGGASWSTLTLPRPAGVVPVRVGGGASDVAFIRPPGAAVRVHVRGGATDLRLDGRTIDAAGKDAQWQSPGAGRAADRYEIEIAGGASKVTVEAR